MLFKDLNNDDLFHTKFNSEIIYKKIPLQKKPGCGCGKVNAWASSKDKYIRFADNIKVIKVENNDV